MVRALAASSVALTASALVLLAVQIDALLFPLRGRAAAAALVVLASASAVVMPLALRPPRAVAPAPVPLATERVPPARRLVIKPRRKADRTRHDLELGHGALLVMGGACQRHYVHGVPRQAGARGERISLTFRMLLRAP